MSGFQEFCDRSNTRQFPVAWPGHWVGGQWKPHPKGKLNIVSLNPSRGTTLIEVAQEKSVVTQAIDAAARYTGSLGVMPLWERMRILRGFADAFAERRETVISILQAESGKPRWEAIMEADAASRHLDWVITNAEELVEGLIIPGTTRTLKGDFAISPVGVTLAYLPFNAPMTTLATYLAAGMLSGCPLVVMPSSHALMTGLFVAYVAESLGLPPDVINVVFGDFDGFRLGLSDRRVEAVLFTGSREHCDTIRLESKGNEFRQMALASGGKNSVIVHESADPDLTLRCVVHGLTKSAGQLCASTSRLMLPRAMSAGFLEILVDALKNIAVAPTDEDGKESEGPGAHRMGPLYSKKAVEKFLRYETMANREGRSVLWGKAMDIGAGGFFVSPGVHVMRGFDAKSAYQANVLFCPSLAVYEYDSVEDAIGWTNVTDAPYVTSFIGDPAVARSLRGRFAAPNLMVSLPTVETDASLPLAGKRQAGHYRFSGPGLALMLTYPQILNDGVGERERVMREWPWQ